MIDQLVVMINDLDIIGKRIVAVKFTFIKYRGHSTALSTPDIHLFLITDVPDFLRS